ncbi:MAG: electron transfer flavoprotein subunit beta/FixA family protein [Candidatus Marinimicrobia bacterium]|nr:electron transfer flavoprotein subunit beta/FixA family protein [Candidatus Neomarinimicrobiota bacterium]MBL7022579.1 electron transfer flavoprotein subunit beta/FixA family protein [Candidatus Neomarinimicrobiota bacterium]MBL7108935.1 electron transfer flavoprotein subunit beta/FixA family protein [Candidatus Neomarinimicrobiota bacterium]
MKICVLVKQVPDSDSLIKIADDNLTIIEDGITSTTNECDTYALEEALLLKEKHGGEVVVCSMGKDSAVQVVKDGLAKGADRGIMITDEKFENFDALATSKVFASVLKDENFDLIFTGLQSDDTGNAQVGVILAELLNTSHSSLVIGTEMVGDTVIKVKRELEGGWAQWTELDLPASLTIQSGLNKPRYASLRGIMMMKKKPLQTMSASDIDLDDIATKAETKQIYVPQKTKETEFISGSPDEIVEQLMEKLTNEIKVLG